MLLLTQNSGGTLQNPEAYSAEKNAKYQHLIAQAPYILHPASYSRAH
jgi:hypothetical protein